eukprot:GILJ01017472.1.p1 GENE.GILJ01017472.1~~GILJ01017472.1.p1  ORF type:complete len:951 (-),score=121.27 GILJ01017472.1:87-2600(-)
MGASGAAGGSMLGYYGSGMVGVPTSMGAPTMMTSFGSGAQPTTHSNNDTVVMHSGGFGVTTSSTSDSRLTAAATPIDFSVAMGPAGVTGHLTNSGSGLTTMGSVVDLHRGDGSYFQPMASSHAYQGQLSGSGRPPQGPAPGLSRSSSSSLSSVSPQRTRVEVEVPMVSSRSSITNPLPLFPPGASTAQPALAGPPIIAGDPRSSSSSGKALVGTPTLPPTVPPKVHPIASQLQSNTGSITSTDLHSDSVLPPLQNTSLPTMLIPRTASASHLGATNPPEAVTDSSRSNSVHSHSQLHRSAMLSAVAAFAPLAPVEAPSPLRRAVVEATAAPQPALFAPQKAPPRPPGGPSMPGNRNGTSLQGSQQADIPMAQHSHSDSDSRQGRPHNSNHTSSYRGSTMRNPLADDGVEEEVEAEEDALVEVHPPPTLVSAASGGVAGLTGVLEAAKSESDSGSTNYLMPTGVGAFADSLLASSTFSPSPGALPAPSPTQPPPSGLQQRAGAKHSPSPNSPRQRSIHAHRNPLADDEEFILINNHEDTNPLSEGNAEVEPPPMEPSAIAGAAVVAPPIAPSSSSSSGSPRSSFGDNAYNKNRIPRSSSFKKSTSPSPNSGIGAFGHTSTSFSLDTTSVAEAVTYTIAANPPAAIGLRPLLKSSTQEHVSSEDTEPQLLSQDTYEGPYACGRRSLRDALTIDSSNTSSHIAESVVPATAKYTSNPLTSSQSDRQPFHYYVDDDPKTTTGASSMGDFSPPSPIYSPDPVRGSGIFDPSGDSAPLVVMPRVVVPQSISTYEEYHHATPPRGLLPQPQTEVDVPVSKQQQGQLYSVVGAEQWNVDNQLQLN